MPSNKDYYAILGVLPGAEDIVIRAAYRALAQRYHPDRFKGSKLDAHARMSELNEAYGVLSDAKKRSDYDRGRSAKKDAGSGAFGDTEERAPPGDDPLAAGWQVALKYYPDLAACEARLALYSWKLANAYRAYLLETKQFETRELLARLMENHFLSLYFGDDPKVADFARRLLAARQRKAALALNSAIRVLGAGRTTSAIIAKIGRDHGVCELTVDKETLRILLAAAKAVSAQRRYLAQLLSELGGSCAFEESDCSRTASDAACKVEFEGRHFEFESDFEFRTWFKKEILPYAERLTG